jgi:hypothetical protein
VISDTSERLTESEQSYPSLIDQLKQKIIELESSENQSQSWKTQVPKKSDDFRHDISKKKNQKKSKKRSKDSAKPRKSRKKTARLSDSYSDQADSDFIVSDHDSGLDSSCSQDPEPLSLYRQFDNSEGAIVTSDGRSVSEKDLDQWDVWDYEESDEEIEEPENEERNRECLESTHVFLDNIKHDQSLPTGNDFLDRVCSLARHEGMTNLKVLDQTSYLKGIISLHNSQHALYDIQPGVSSLASKNRLWSKVYEVIKSIFLNRRDMGGSGFRQYLKLLVVDERRYQRLLDEALLGNIKLEKFTREEKRDYRDSVSAFYSLPQQMQNISYSHNILRTDLALQQKFFDVMCGVCQAWKKYRSSVLIPLCGYVRFQTPEPTSESDDESDIEDAFEHDLPICTRCYPFISCGLKIIDFIESWREFPIRFVLHQDSVSKEDKVLLLTCVCEALLDLCKDAEGMAANPQEEPEKNFQRESEDEIILEDPLSYMPIKRQVSIDSSDEEYEKEATSFDEIGYGEVNKCMIFAVFVACRKSENGSFFLVTLREVSLPDNEITVRSPLEIQWDFKKNEQLNIDGVYKLKENGEFKFYLARHSTVSPLYEEVVPEEVLKQRSLDSIRRRRKLEHLNAVPVSNERKRKRIIIDSDED